MQDCELHSIPRQLAAATALRRLRIGRNGLALSFQLDDLDVLAALPRLNFLEVAKVPATLWPVHNIALWKSHISHRCSALRFFRPCHLPSHVR